METKPLAKPFLSTTWSHLAMLNYEIDPALLAPYVPLGTELDSHEGRTCASMVGFLYHDTRVCGWAVPGHRHFAEVNLRFYVRRYEGDELRRGVVFVKEIVPRWAVAMVARVLYDERFIAIPMRHEIKTDTIDAIAASRVRYGWRTRGRQWNELAVVTSGSALLPVAGSEEEFITEHYWGYTARRDGSTSEYRVEHPQWRVWRAENAEFQCDIAALYGREFVEPLSQPPCSAFLAEGSPVAVYRGRRLAAELAGHPTPA